MAISTELNDYYDFWIGMNAVYDKWAKKHNLTVNALFTLYILLQSTTECTQRLLCDKLFLPKQTINAILDSLISSGYVDKIVSEGDKRSKLVRLTTEGRLFADKVISELDVFEMGAIGKMTKKETRALITNSQIYLNHLTEGLNNPVK